MLQATTRSDELHIPLAGVFAVIGCDGSGKTTLTRDLAQSLGNTRSAKRRYLGLVSGEMGDKIQELTDYRRLA